MVETLRQQNRDLQIEKDTEVSHGLQTFVKPVLQVESLGKQVSSLNARAAHTANSQLALLQDENKKMVAERTVLQTQV